MSKQKNSTGQESKNNVGNKAPSSDVKTARAPLQDLSNSAFMRRKLYDSKKSINLVKPHIVVPRREEKPLSHNNVGDRKIERQVARVNYTQLISKPISHDPIIKQQLERQFSQLSKYIEDKKELALKLQIELDHSIRWYGLYDEIIEKELQLSKYFTRVQIDIIKYQQNLLLEDKENNPKYITSQLDFLEQIELIDRKLETLKIKEHDYSLSRNKRQLEWNNQHKNIEEKKREIAKDEEFLITAKGLAEQGLARPNETIEGLNKRMDTHERFAERSLVIQQQLYQQLQTSFQEIQDLKESKNTFQKEFIEFKQTAAKELAMVKERINGLEQAKIELTNQLNIKEISLEEKKEELAYIHEKIEEGVGLSDRLHQLISQVNSVDEILDPSKEPLLSDQKEIDEIANQWVNKIYQEIGIDSEKTEKSLRSL